MLISTFRRTVAVWLFISLSAVAFAQNTQLRLANEYYQLGELEKARTEYKKLARNKRNLPRIHDNYFKLLLTLEDYDEAQKYMRNVMRQVPENFLYEVDYGMLLMAMKDEQGAQGVFQNLVKKVAQISAANKRTNDIRILAQTLFEKNLREWALTAYTEGRRALGRPGLFSLELANAYRLMNQKRLMIGEYLTFAKSQPQNASYVKNSFQRSLTEPGDLDTLEVALYEFIQEEAGNPVYNDLLVWTHLQQKNFTAALRQARALDLRMKGNGQNIINVGMIAFRNKDFKNAQKAFGYILQEFPDTPSRTLAAKYALLAEEEVIKTTYPVDTTAIRELVVKYEQSKEQARDVFSALDFQRRKALLHAFYLNEIPEAIQILDDLVKQPVGKHRVIAESKMDLADIYLLNKEPWESILLYAQVEKMYKDEPLGYEAKLKSAKLSYFKGEFELAQGHLDILKLATSREIANDALELSILIKNNTVFDSTDVVMQEYANVELMLFQNQKDEAIAALDSMSVRYANHSILDEVYYLKAQTLRELGRFDAAIETLQKINESFYYEILGDDALFLTAVILEEDLVDHDRAMAMYTELLKKFPGSIYVAESRKRFRVLRGDF